MYDIKISILASSAPQSYPPHDPLVYLLPAIIPGILLSVIKRVIPYTTEAADLCLTNHTSTSILLSVAPPNLWNSHLQFMNLSPTQFMDQLVYGYNKYMV